MQKTKAKRGLPAKNSWGYFAVLWTLMYVAGRLISEAFSLTEPDDYLTRQQVIIVSLMLGLIPTLLQVLMIERVFKQSMRGWLALTMLGTLITLLINPWAWPMSPPVFGSDVRFFLNVAAMIVPSLVLQTVWLWRHVKSAWLWPLLRAARWLFFVGLTRFVAPIFDSPGVWVITLLDIFIEGGVLHYLLARPQNAEKAKVDFAADEDSDDERIERLQDRERSNPLWDTGDGQALQSEA